MSEKKYSIGIDYGTLSGRAVLLDLENGEEIADSTLEYPHAVMSEELEDGTKLEPDWALEHPQDYLDVLHKTIPDVIKKAGIKPDQVIGVGIDFTACTPMPIKSDGTPLCFMDEYKSNPHAYTKLWKHHASQEEATRLNEIAEERFEEFLPRYGGKISSEWMIPKIWQILNEAPEIYDEMDYFIEAADWVIFKLTGKLQRNACTAGYKSLWHKQKGYPDKEFFKALDPRLENVVETKLNNPIVPLGTKAGEITQEAAELTGLIPGTAVAVANVDAHVACTGAGMTKPGQMLLIMGTSTCHMLLAEDEKIAPGMCGVVEDGILPGMMGYEAGQSCVGDHFQWLVQNCVPGSYYDEAEKKGITIYQLLTEKAEKLKPGESGLLALDWWNGNRSVLVDGELSGIMVGFTLNTKVEEIFRTLVEATAYGTRKIIETFEESGIPIDELIIAGGIAKKNPFMMQIYADVTRKSIVIAPSVQLPARSSAIYGAVAAGKSAGGFDNVFDAIEKLAEKPEIFYKPNEDAAKIYDQLYEDYTELHDYFGRGGNDVMKRLKKLKAEQKKI